MNSKKVNWLFTTIIIINILVMVGLMFVPEDFSIGTMESLLLSQAMILVPAVLFMVFTKTKPGDLIALGRPKLLTSLLVVGFTYLCMPLVMTVNALSMIFVENEVTNLGSMLGDVPSWQVILMIGFLGPISEELTFRGVIYHGYRRSGRLVAAMVLSAVLFGLMHMNFNQMSYAILLGVLMVLLVEGTGSIFYAILFHVCINLTNVIQMVVQDSETAAMDAAAAQQMIESTLNMSFRQAMCITASFLAVVSCFTTALAGCLYYLILKREGRTEHIRLMFRKTEKKQRIITWPLIVSMVFCVAYMILMLFVG